MIFRKVARGRRPCRGVTLIELVATFAILAFVSLGTIQLYRVGDQQQRIARLYSTAQSEAREGLRRILRTARHASAVETSGATTFYPSLTPASSSTQLIVTTPQPGSGGGSDHIRFYLSGTTLYAQRSDDTSLGTAIATGVQSVTFTYYQTAVTSTSTTVTDVTSTSPPSSTEVKIVLVMSVFNSQTTTRTGYVTMRNRVLGF